MLGATLPERGPKYRHGSCSTVTVNLEPTHPTNCGHIPATLPDNTDSSKLESGAVAATLRSTLFRSVLLDLAPRSHLEGLQLLAALPDDTNSSTRTSSAPLASAIPHTTRWLSPLQDAPAPSTSWADSFQNLVKVVALVYPPRRLSPAASTLDISPFKVTAPATFIDPCNRSLSLVKYSRQV